MSRVQHFDIGPSDDDGSKQMTGRSSSLFGGRARMDPPAAAVRVKRSTTPQPNEADRTGTKIGSAPMGGRTPAKDLWGDGMINEADRGGAHDY